MYIIHLSPPLRTVKTLLRCTRAFKHRERKLYTVYFGIVHKEAPLREFPRYFTDSATQYDAALVSGAACYSKERNKTDFCRRVMSKAPHRAVVVTRLSYSTWLHVLSRIHRIRFLCDFGFFCSCFFVFILITISHVLFTYTYISFLACIFKNIRVQGIFCVIRSVNVVSYIFRYT